MNLIRKNQLLISCFYMFLIVFLGILSNGYVDFQFKNVLFELGSIFTILILFTCDKYAFDNVKWMLAIYIFTLVIANGSRAQEYIQIIVLAFLFYNNRKPMVITHFLTIFVYLLVTCIFSYFGYLPFITYDMETYMRHAFVFGHPNQLGQTIFSMMCSLYLICRNKWFKYSDLFIPFGILIFAFTFFYVTSKTSGLLILMLVVFYAFDRFVFSKFKYLYVIYNFICKYCWLIPSALFCIMSFISFVLPTDNAVFLFFSDLLTGRVSLQRMAYEFYGIPLFGLNIFSENPYVDAFYYDFILRYGIIFFLCLLGLITYLLYKKCKDGKGTSYFPLVFLWTLFGFLQPVVLIMCFNPFITYLFDSKEETSC